MDPLIRLGIAMWRLLQRRPGKRHLMLYGVVAGMSLTIALIEWLGYWPAA